jgi:hypothetical protein
MKNIGILLMAMMILVVSCSKEESLETGGSGGSGGGGGTGGGGVTGAKLVKISSDFVLIPTIEFTYDASNRLIKYTNKQDLGGGNTISGQTKVTRDGAGRVIREVGIDDFTGDSSVTVYVYQNATDRKVKYGIDGEDGSPFRDSLIFSYTGDLCTKITFYTSTNSGADYDLYSELTYRYDSRNNVVEATESISDGSALVLAAKYGYEYDTKVNPVYFRDDMLLLNSDLLFNSPNNATKLSFTVFDPNITIAQTVSYQYRSDNKPSKANGNYSGAPYTINYTYQ